MKLILRVWAVAICLIPAGLASDGKPLYAVQISPAKGEAIEAADKPDRIIVQNQPLKAIIAILWKTSPARIVFPDEMDAGRYDITASVPEGDDEAISQLVRDTLERRFDLWIEWEPRVEPVFVLRAGQEPDEQPRAMSGNSSGTAMADIARQIEALVGKPVVDETGLTGRYRYSVPNDLPGPKAAWEIAKQLGLQVSQEDREIDVLIVRKVK